MRHLVLTILLIGIVGSGITMPLASAQETPENPLLRLLRFIPDTAENRQEVRYGDFAAWYESWSVAPPVSIEAIESMDDFDRAYTLFIMPNQTLPTQALGTDEVMRGFRDYYGFDVFNVDRFLYAGFPTNDITVIEHSLDASRITDALTALGYQTEPREPDATLYFIRGDYELDISADVPNVGRLGILNRILMRDGQMVITRATPVVDAAWASQMGETPSLADNPTYAAAAAWVESLGKTYGTPLGVALLPPDSFQLLLEDFPADVAETITAQFAPFEQWTIPPYELVILSTHHSQATTYTTIGLVFPPGTDTSGVEDNLVSRMKNYTSLVTHILLSAMLADRGVTFGDSFSAELNGQPVVFVVMEQPDPPHEKDDNGRVPTAILSWYDFYIRRDMLFLTFTLPE